MVVRNQNIKGRRSRSPNASKKGRRSPLPSEFSPFRRARLRPRKSKSKSKSKSRRKTYIRRSGSKDSDEPIWPRPYLPIMPKPERFLRIGRGLKVKNDKVVFV